MTTTSNVVESPRFDDRSEHWIGETFESWFNHLKFDKIVFNRWNNRTVQGVEWWFNWFNHSGWFDFKTQAETPNQFCEMQCWGNFFLVHEEGKWYFSNVQFSWFWYVRVSVMKIVFLLLQKHILSPLKCIKVKLAIKFLC